MQVQARASNSQLAQKLAGLTKPVSESGPCLLASATYNGETRKAVLKFYDPDKGRFWLWEDNTGHRPYCYTRLSRDELGVLDGRKDIVEIVDEDRLDLLNDTTVRLRKVVTTDPLAIGGGNDSIRDRIKAWEADIKYYENFTYDRGLRMGTYYRLAEGEVVPVRHDVPEKVSKSLEEITKRNPKEFQPYLSAWAELLGEPLCDFRRIALDIEVANEEGRVPDPEDPKRPVIAVSFYNESEKVVYALRSGKGGEDALNRPYTLRVFDDEHELLRAVMSKIIDYPFVITFNGDDFDLRYLKHRAEALGIQEEENPIQLERVAATLKHGVHVDLYQFFRNKSIQVYAFSNKYTEHTLGGICEALLNKSKIEFEGEIGDLPLSKLAEYCLNDSQLTYELTTMSGGVVMKLLLMISRIGRMPINDVSRLGVSNWIRSMLFYEHRRIGALIPRQDELTEKGGASSQAIIKGKKYKGGFVIEPKPGAYFDVSVLDFASLYPSLIKVQNLSYETVDCVHPGCRTNKIPDTDSWVCSRRRGIVSLVTGSLRDLRVSHYKPLARDATLSKDDRELYNVVSQGLKIFLNASYGVLGFETFAFYCLPVAEATAALGRDTITRTIQKCKEAQIDVVYGDSITGERCVTVLDSAGRLRVIPVERLYSLFPGALQRPDGKEEVHPTGWKALSMNPMTGRVEFKPLTAVIRHRTKKKVFLVREERGLTKVTEDHSLLSTDGVGYAFTKPLALGPRHLVRTERIPEVDHLDVVDVYESVKDIRYEVRYKGRKRALEPHCDEDWVWFGWTGRKQSVRVRRWIRPDSEEFRALVELLGAYVSEGSSSTPDAAPGRFVASVANGDVEWLERVRKSYFTLFDDANASVIRSKQGRRRLSYPTSSGQVVILYEDHAYRLQMMNETAAVFFEAFAGQGSGGKRVPGFIFHSADEHKLAFLDSLVKGDGSGKYGPRYSEAYTSNNFRYETKSLELASGLSTLLLLLGIKHTIGYRAPQGTYIISASSKCDGRESVVRVREEEHHGYVYDLSVADYHTFVDSCGSVVLKNTDSLFLKSPSKTQVTDVTRWADSELGVELDLDKVYRYVAFSSRKKNYFGVLPDGTVDIRGLTGKKSQTPDYLKEVFYKALDILKAVQTPEDFESARTKTKELLSGMISDLKGRKVPVEKLAFNVMMSKPTGKYDGTTPQHVRAAKLLEEKGREIKAGEIIAFVKTKSPPYVKPVGLARVEDVDSDKYIEYAHSMFDQMLDALDFSFDELMGGTTLDLFWGQ